MTATIMVITIIFFGFFFNVLPWVIALLSDKARGQQKLIWFILSFFGSWIGFLVYYYLIIKPEWENTSRIPRDENGMPIKMYRSND
jgi:hypothetical protein